jgi:hypothetical protein
MCACGSSAPESTAAASVYADAPRVTGRATDGALAVPFSLDASGAGTDRIGAIVLAGGAGTARIDGRAMQAAALGRIPFAGDDVFQVLAVDDARWAVVWIYCSAGTIRGAYVESTDSPGPATSEGVAGSCNAGTTPADVHVTFPSFNLAAPALSGQRFVVSGAGVTYDGASPGAITLGGAALTLYPFGVVDCTRGCGPVGWYELHSLIWDASTKSASFGILYLYEDAAFPVELAYTVTLPGLTRFGDAIAFPGTTWQRAL